jgi:hypothetical protein
MLYALLFGVELAFLLVGSLVPEQQGLLVLGMIGLPVLELVSRSRRYR